MYYCNPGNLPSYQLVEFLQKMAFRFDYREMHSSLK